MTTDPSYDVVADSSSPVDGWSDSRLDGHESHLPQPSRDHPEALLSLGTYEVANLKAQLQTLPVIEQAKGMLMHRYRLGPDDAFAVLRRWSSHTNVKLREICRLLVDSAVHGPAGTSDHGDQVTSLRFEEVIRALTDGRMPPEQLSETARSTGARLASEARTGPQRAPASEDTDRSAGERSEPS